MHTDQRRSVNGEKQIIFHSGQTETSSNSLAFRHFNTFSESHKSFENNLTSSDEHATTDYLGWTRKRKKIISYQVAFRLSRRFPFHIFKEKICSKISYR